MVPPIDFAAKSGTNLFPVEEPEPKADQPVDSGPSGATGDPRRDTLGQSGIPGHRVRQATAVRKSNSRHRALRRSHRDVVPRVPISLIGQRLPRPQVPAPSGFIAVTAGPTPAVGRKGEGRTVREEARGGFAPAEFNRSKFEISAALLQLCLCTACQVGPDHQVMKGPDRVEIGEA